MTIKDFLELTPEDISRMSFGERKDLVDDISSKANRRLDRLSELDIPAPSLSSRLDDDGNLKYFSSDDKNTNQLSNELKNLQRFLNNKTSTVTGAKQSAIRMYAKLTGTPVSKVSLSEVNSMYLNNEKMNVFWSAYNKVLESNPGIISTKSNDIAGQFTSGQVQQRVYEIFSQNTNMNSDELWLKAQEFLDSEYEPPAAPGLNPFTFTRHG